MNESEMMTAVEARVLLEIVSYLCKNLILTRQEVELITKICLNAIERAEREV